MIYQRQYQKILAAELLRYLLLGKLPNVEEISRRITAALGKDGKITYQYVPQPFKSVFQHTVYNKGLRKIKFDIDTLHEEILSLFADALERTNYADIYYKVHSYELNRLKAQLDMLLFTIQDADFYFLGAYDNFSDNTKLDTKASTQSVIDLSEQAIMLPYGGSNTQRIGTGHLSNLVSYPVKLNTPDRSLVVKHVGTQDSKFGNMFVDTTSSWAQEVITTEQVPVEIQFTFPLAGAQGSEVEVFVNRFELVPHSASKQTVIIKTSTDNVNFIAPLGYEQGLVLEDQKKVYGMDFETTLVQYVTVILRKDTADQEILTGQNKRYQYLFGLKNFSAYTTGRLQTARYQSKPFSFEDNKQISKVSLFSNSTKPGGTNINYSIALADASGPTSSFIPISPVNDSKITGTSSIVSFNTTVPFKSRFTVMESGDDAAIAYGAPFQGKTFYRIGDTLTPPPVFGSANLYRGFKGWYRDSTRGFEIIDVSDNYVSFEQTDLEAIYAVVTEVPGATAQPLATDGIRRILLTLSKAVYYDSNRGHALKPQPGVQSSNLDIKPNYAVYKVEQLSTTATQYLEFTLTSQRTQSLPSANFLLQSTNPTELPVLRYTSGQILTPNIDYVIETEDIGGRRKPTGMITIPTGSVLIDSNGNVQIARLVFVCTGDPDITHKVAVIEDNFVTLNNAVLTAADTIKITYRYIPTAPSEIIQASIRVSNLPTTSSSRTFYVEGRDYNVDSSTGAIQRIPTGGIETHGSVYVQFSYRNAASSIETFITWCNIVATEGVQLKFDLDPTTKKNRFVVDEELGEAFYVNSPQGLVTLTKAASSPVLGPGWVQFIVRSKNPDSNQTFESNLIDQVIQSRDISKKRIFRENGLYFQEILAFRDPIKQRTVNHLKVNTLMLDHQVFAIDDITDPTANYIIVNFLPNTTSELYLRVPSDALDEDTRPSTAPEEFLITWDGIIENNEVSGNKLIVRIDLERKQGIDGALTPKVFGYQIRAGF